MKKKYIFTKDSSFTHLKDEMHKFTSTHIIKDDQTMRLYYHLVSYGSPRDISDESIFMSHLLRKIGVTGFCTSYLAEDCKITLPYTSKRRPTKPVIIELPQGIKLEDVSFGRALLEESEKFKHTFLGKKISVKSDEVYSGKDLIKCLFGCSIEQIGSVNKKDKTYPLYEISSDVAFNKESKQSFISLLKALDKKLDYEIYAILDKFASLDISQMIEEFESEIGRSAELMSKELELLYKQSEIKKHLIVLDERVM